MKSILVKMFYFIMGLVFSIPYLAIQWAKVCAAKKQPPWKLIG